MKKDTHPLYKDVLFIDTSNGHKFVIGSSVKCEENQEFEGKEYPVHYVTISSASHPFFTGSQQFVDSEGRVDKFMKRYASAPAAAPVAKSSEDSPAKKAKKAKKKKK
jgi:large subunit ribosomal protein L31